MILLFFYKYKVLRKSLYFGQDLCHVIGAETSKMKEIAKTKRE